MDCAECHTTAGWKVEGSKIKFDHNTTAFTLAGQHKSVECRQCHKTLKFSEAGKDCAYCHTDIHKNSVGSDCAKCHTPQTWLVLNVNQIHQKSRFPLLGIHINLDCAQCHEGYSELRFEVHGISCYDCHSADYRAAKNPDHASSNFSTECQTCHSISSSTWSASGFNHDFFPLIEGHKISNCFSCHTPGNFGGLSKDCYACHKTTFETVSNPNHISAGFSTDCTECHNISGWKPSAFDHSTTGFTLSGAHLGRVCKDCHSSGFKGTLSDCYSCHKTDYESAKDPNHLDAKFPTACGQCHTTSVWKPANFDHSVTNFPLTGKHVSVACSSCHSSGYTGTPTDCYSCHKNNYDNSTNPNHVTSGFPTTCEQCHTTSAWRPATFDHNLTKFPLTGRHISVACSQCHASGYTNTPTACYSCHTNDYNGTTNPNHLSAKFPTACEQCHTTSGWRPATFDHDGLYFPIYSGNHKGEWNTCADCHLNENDYSSFSCINCHEHSNKSKVDSDHRGVANYVYQSQACYNCHPTGRKG